MTCPIGRTQTLVDVNSSDIPICGFPGPSCDDSRDLRLGDPRVSIRAVLNRVHFKSTSNIHGYTCRASSSTDLPINNHSLPEYLRSKKQISHACTRVAI